MQKPPSELQPDLHRYAIKNQLFWNNFKSIGLCRCVVVPVRPVDLLVITYYLLFIYYCVFSRLATEEMTLILRSQD